MPFTRQAKQPTVVAVLVFMSLAVFAEAIVPTSDTKAKTARITTTSTVSPAGLLIGDNINNFITNNDPRPSLAVLDLLESTMQTYYNHHRHHYEGQNENEKDNNDYTIGVIPRNVMEDEISSSTGFAPNRLRLAYMMEGTTRKLKVPDNVYRRAVEIVKDAYELTIAAVIRQEHANTGSIVSFSQGANRYLELESSGRRDEVRLHYIGRGNQRIYTEVFPYPLADGYWHAVALTLSGTQARLYVDCRLVYTRTLPGGIADTRFASMPELYVGQRNQEHSVYKGDLQDVRLIRGVDGHRVQCPKLDTSCPTCGQFAALQNVVERILNDFRLLNDKFEAAQLEIAQMRTCECRKACVAVDKNNNTIVKNDGSTWKNGCETCSCVRGQVECSPITCLPVNCTNPVRKPGECCDSCLASCNISPHGIVEHGNSVNLDPCVSCVCDNAVAKCTRTECPKLSCHESEQIPIPDQCCKFCPDVDYCTRGGRDLCHPNATCINLRTTHKCTCAVGYSGSGIECDDINECSSIGGQNGHHCDANTTICVNTPGSYTCKCREGYIPLNSFECIDVDECSTTNRPCHPHASCKNTPGGYECQCAEGYEGDGFTCRPICRQKCQNGGSCVSPDVCQCLAAFDGPLCELDVDECATGIHRCTDPSSHCVNMAGWYYCACNPGFQSKQLYPTTIINDTIITGLSNVETTTWSPNIGSMCRDIDECATNNHTCHPSTKCVNTIGSYECHCLENTSDKISNSSQYSECKSSCLVKNINGIVKKEIDNGSWFLSEECTNCTCNSGHLNCKRIECDCSNKDHSRLRCCAECDAQLSCSHQELPNVWFRSGQQWIYQCQTCECLMGQVDCWPMQCPPLLPQGANCTLLTPTIPTFPDTNNDPIIDCCSPQVSDLIPSSLLLPVATATVALVVASNPCLKQHNDEKNNSTFSTAGGPCTYKGRVYQSGEYWDDPVDLCTSCNCKDGTLCCSYDMSHCNHTSASSLQRHSPVAVHDNVPLRNGNPSSVRQETLINTNFHKTPVTESRKAVAKRSRRSRRQLLTERRNGGIQKGIENETNNSDYNLNSRRAYETNENWWWKKTRRRKKIKRVVFITKSGSS
ncbi:protein kinase C-binding protein NELL2-like isoform X2 [Daktulosphaira vitifoliae]|uniref:protein kinase C-binding protein NELL2-like isoform X2 n=1 Tax=Daktulosphaira vitifoliae TaxID=58002 RepID=UPI0021A991AB|nr:protein kinase C-binding protein NELL2-like isoform X2 [Daktulosphaira vitifoliae]